MSDIDRRNLLRSAAWAAPVVAVAATAPLAAASELGLAIINFAARETNPVVTLSVSFDPAYVGALDASMFTVAGHTPRNVYSSPSGDKTLWLIQLLFLSPRDPGDSVIVTIPGYQTAFATVSW